MDSEKVVSFLRNTRERLDTLQHLPVSQSSEELKNIILQVKMIIRRIYPDAEKVEKKLYPPARLVGNVDLDYLEGGQLSDIEYTKRAIDMVLKEHELFGFEDFTPEKERVEKEWKIGNDGLGFLRKKTTK